MNLKNNKSYRGAASSKLLIFSHKNKTMKLSTTRLFENSEATIIVDWRNGKDYDIIQIRIDNWTSSIDVTDMFTSDEIIEEIFGAIDWQMIYNQNHT